MQLGNAFAKRDLVALGARNASQDGLITPTANHASARWMAQILTMSMKIMMWCVIRKMDNVPARVTTVDASAHSVLLDTLDIRTVWVRVVSRVTDQSSRAPSCFGSIATYCDYVVDSSITAQLTLGKKCHLFYALENQQFF